MSFENLAATVRKSGTMGSKKNRKRNKSGGGVHGLPSSPQMARGPADPPATPGEDPVANAVSDDEPTFSPIEMAMDSPEPTAVVSPESLSDVLPELTSVVSFEPEPASDPIPATPPPATPTPATPVADPKTPIPERVTIPPPQTPAPETEGSRTSPQNKMRTKAVDLVRLFDRKMQAEKLRTIHLTNVRFII